MGCLHLLHCLVFVCQEQDEEADDDDDDGDCDPKVSFHFELYAYVQERVLQNTLRQRNICSDAQALNNLLVCV